VLDDLPPELDPEMIEMGLDGPPVDKAVKRAPRKKSAKSEA
jgi:hypothetical protein